MMAFVHHRGSASEYGFIEEQQQSKYKGHMSQDSDRLPTAGSLIRSGTAAVISHLHGAQPWHYYPVPDRILEVARNIKAVNSSFSG